MQHDFGCRHGGIGHTDAAKRLSDTYNMHLTAGVFYGASNLGKVIAVALSDGRSDGTVYDSKSDAVWHQNHNEQYYAFIRINPSSMSVCAAEATLKSYRQIYDAQVRLNDRYAKGGGPDVIPRLNREDQYIQDDIFRTGKGKFAIGHAE